MAKVEHCTRRDCKYRNTSSSEAWNCNYALITGRTRIERGQTPEEQQPCNCTKYAKGKPIKARSAEYFIVLPGSRSRNGLANGDGYKPPVAALSIGSSRKKNAAASYTYKPKITYKKPDAERGPRIDWELGRMLYSLGYGDTLTARALGCAAVSVRRWRKQEGLPGGGYGRSKETKARREAELLSLPLTEKQHKMIERVTI